MTLLNSKEEVLSMKKLSPQTKAALSALIAGTVSIASHAQATESSDARQPESLQQSPDMLEQLDVFVALLQADSELLSQYLEDPETVLRNYGFGPVLIREVLREDGFVYTAPGEEEFDGCMLTCACTGCCATCSVTSGNSNSGNGNGNGNGNTGGGGGGGGGGRQTGV
jgi:hypothetical protein